MKLPEWFNDLKDSAETPLDIAFWDVMERSIRDQDIDLTDEPTGVLWQALAHLFPEDLFSRVCWEA